MDKALSGRAAARSCGVAFSDFGDETQHWVLAGTTGRAARFPMEPQA